MVNGIKAEELLELIPEEKLAEFAAETQVDYGVKKFTGHLLFKLLLYSVIKSNKVSQRVIESFFNSRPFQFLVNLEAGSRTRHSTISERLAHVDVAFFRRLHDFVVHELSERYQVQMPKGLPIKRFDSTTVSLSSNLLHFGMSNDDKAKTSKRANGLHQIKFSIGFDGLFASQVKCYTEQNYLNENLALSEAILTQKEPQQGIHVFDRGLRGRQTFALLTEQKVQFVTRVDAFPLHELIETLPVQNPLTPTLEILEDLKVYLFSTSGKVKVPLRMITAVRHDSEEALCFLTNIFDLPTDQITEIYKKRWDIEVFFKFLKQELNFSHFVSRTQNGIQVMLYITLIAAMLILIYRHINELKGFKYVKMQFVQDLEWSLIKNLIELCGGDPNRLDQYPLRQ